MLLWLAILSVYSVRPFGLVGNSKPDKGGWVFDLTPSYSSLLRGEFFYLLRYLRKAAVDWVERLIERIAKAMENSHDNFRCLSHGECALSVLS